MQKILGYIRKAVQDFDLIQKGAKSQWEYPAARIALFCLPDLRK